ncbi:MAG: T9SS type A sorting domain-containing protein [Bacteroidales bacterium]|nr:T9SS type A sorting domain-containing protein [Bacteroidales bacterium]MCF8337801.1 T9SS type A sorting domain-containing protein [Bacteroidales bacterium]
MFISGLLKHVLSSLFLFATIFYVSGQGDTSRLPIGMNIPNNNYYTKNLIFNDAMKTASPWISYYAENDSVWDSQMASLIPKDSGGYPLQIPYTPEGESPQAVRTLINNYYNGTFYLKFDGSGQVSIHNTDHQKINSNKYEINLNGQGGHVWIHIESSQENDHIRNMRIIPKEWDKDESSMPLFHEKFLEGLEPFHAIRFMNWMNTNNSYQEAWDDRSVPHYYSQGLSNGIAIEYAIRLCNTLQTDAWFCVPHRADDNYITNFAEMVRDSLDGNLNVYVEYSNEVWNWIFDQSHYVLENAPGHNNAYVSDSLASINPEPADHPEKDAYMMQRTFRLWSEVFTGPDANRLIRVGTGQHAWVDNSRRILKFLFKTDQDGNPVSGGAYETSSGEGCDVFSVAGYFNFTEEHHEAWLEMDPDSVTPEMIIDSAAAVYDETAGMNTEQTAEYTNAWDVGYTVYEGGQHMQPWNQQDWPYNQAVWDAQIHPDMYDLYMNNFEKHTEEKVDCQLFMAFSYVSERESVYGSWGHLEAMQQIGEENYMDIAPKYQALLDANSIPTNNVNLLADKHNSGLLNCYPNPTRHTLNIRYRIPEKGRYSLELYTITGRNYSILNKKYHSIGQYTQHESLGEYPKGMYILRLLNSRNKEVQSRKVLKY